MSAIKNALADALDLLTRKIDAGQCIDGCGLLAASGDVFCEGCREGFERNRPLSDEYEGYERKTV